ncbi:MAG: baseplate J/gp47 family protein [Rhodobacteraceae bacterium]|nr:baseplate J/gp47 family protein [Paracoccaceae bacterium]
MTNLPDLSALPPPEVVEEISYEDILAAVVARIKAGFAAVGVDWDVDQLETDAAKIIAEADAYLETLLRSRINYVAQQGFLYYATGGNLEQLTALLGVYRMEGESDDRLKERFRLATIGRSAGGPAERYRSVVLGADIDVRDVAIWREGRDPTVNVAVLSESGNGEPTQALLDVVETALTQPDIQVVSDTFNVVSAIRKTVDVSLSVRLDPTAADSVADQVATTVQVEWQKQDLLGLDLTRAFLIQAAGIAGVTNVEVAEPEADTVALENEAIAINSVTVTVSGRGR